MIYLSRIGKNNSTKQNEKMDKKKIVMQNARFFFVES